MAGADESFLSWKGELCRKGIHLLSLLMPICYFIFKDLVIVVGLMAALAISFLFDMLRLFGNHHVKTFMGINFGFLLRPREKKSFSGSTTIILAGLLVYLLFDLPVAAAAMVIVVIGDVAAAIIGRRFGRIRFRNKSLEGTLAFIIFAMIFIQVIPALPLRIGIAGVMTGALIEFLPIPVDDNITVPLAAGAFMQLLI
jgi:dolichol kinase